MSTRTYCDGCGRQLDPAGQPRAVRGEIAAGTRHLAPLPVFDWCRRCAGIAFAAVSAARHPEPEDT